MKTDPTADEIIDALGGTSETARLFNIQPPSVTGWRRAGIPPARLMFLKVARPDLFAGFAQSEMNAPPRRRRTDVE